MKRFIIYLGLAYAALCTQAIFFQETKPDLVLVMVCFYSLKFGHMKGTAYGAITGLLIDTANGFILGPNIISKALVGFLMKTIRSGFYQWNFLICSLFIAIFSLIDIMVVYLCLEVFSDVSFANRPWGMSFIGVVYTVLASLIIYPLIFNLREQELFSRMSQTR